jgi:Glycine rich protein
MSSTVPANTNLILIDTRTQNKIITLPPVASNPGRILILKDYYGTSANSTITINTQGSDLIDDYNTSYTFSSRYGTLTLVCDGVSSWRLMGLYNGALSLATSLSSVNPATLLPSGGSVNLVYVTPNSATLFLTASTNTVKYNCYVTSSPSSLTAAIPAFSGTALSAGTLVVTAGRSVVGATYYAIVIPYNSAETPGPQFTSSSSVSGIPPGSIASVTMNLSGNNLLATWTAATNTITYTVEFYQVATNTTIGGTLIETNTGITALTKISSSVLINGQYYYVIVYSVNPYGVIPTTSSTAVLGSVTPTNPPSVTITVSGTTLTATWTTGINASTYNVLFYVSSTNTTSGGGGFQTFTGVTGTTKDSTAATGNQLWYYCIVQSVNAFGTSSGTVSSSAVQVTSGNFGYLGTYQYFTIPYSGYPFTLSGAGGGGGAGGANVGNIISIFLNVPANTVVALAVGGTGGSGINTFNPGGWPGGGGAGRGESGAGGGGYTAILSQNLATIYVIAGGGGGGTGYGGGGGAGGYPNGANGVSVGTPTDIATGGTQGGGGASASNGGAGSFLQGGSSGVYVYSGGGGGGGFYGGGAGPGGSAGAALGGGGGGSSYYNGGFCTIRSTTTFGGGSSAQTNGYISPT